MRLAPMASSSLGTAVRQDRRSGSDCRKHPAADPASAPARAMACSHAIAWFICPLHTLAEPPGARWSLQEQTLKRFSGSGLTAAAARCDRSYAQGGAPINPKNSKHRGRWFVAFTTSPMVS